MEYFARPDYDQHYVTGRQWGTVPSYELNEAAGRIDILDKVWGQEIIGDWEGDEISPSYICTQSFSG